MNGALGYVQQTFYIYGSKPPQLPFYKTSVFNNYIGVLFDKENPKLVPISHLERGSRKQIPFTRFNTRKSYG